MIKPAKILIGTPTANGDLCVDYCNTVSDLYINFRKKFPQVTFETRFFETYDLRLVRNCYASMVLNDPSFTHLLFFDSDMGFFPTLLEKMLEADVPVVGTVSPKRSFDDALVFKLAKQLKDIRIAEIAANDYIPESHAYTVAYDEDGETPIAVKHEGSLVTVERGGTGIILIHRSVFERMRDELPDDYEPLAPPNAQLYGVTGGYLRCFDAAQSAAGRTLGEDYAFSQRWVHDLGGKIHLVFDEVIFHVGERRNIGNAAVRYGFRRTKRV